MQSMSVFLFPTSDAPASLFIKNQKLKHQNLKKIECDQAKIN